MKQLALLTFLLLSISSCGQYGGGSGDYDAERRPNIPALEYIMVTYGDELEKEKRLFHVNSCAYYDNYIEKLEMELTTNAVMEGVCPARDLIVYVVEGLLSRINEDDTVGYDVYSYPFSPWNLEINIEFKCFWNKYINKRSIARIRLVDGMVYYYAGDALDPDTICFRQRVEPYEKAYRFSSFKSYRPWEKIPPSERGDSGLRDLGGDDFVDFGFDSQFDSPTDSAILR